MKIGELNKRVILQRLTMTKNTYGEIMEQWDNVATVWASIKPISGREYFAAEAVNSDVTHKVIMRYRADITADMRVKYGDRYFTINSVINANESGISTQLMCRELIK